MEKFLFAGLVALAIPAYKHAVQVANKKPEKVQLAPNSVWLTKAIGVATVGLLIVAAICI